MQQDAVWWLRQIPQCTSWTDVAVQCRAMKACPQLAQTPISIDTFEAEVAQQAVQAGAHMVNDVSGGLMDPNMHATASLSNCSNGADCDPHLNPLFTSCITYMHGRLVSMAYRVGPLLACSIPMPYGYACTHCL